MTPCEFRPLDALGKPEEHSLTQPWPWIRLPRFPLPDGSGEDPPVAFSDRLPGWHKESPGAKRQGKSAFP